MNIGVFDSGNGGEYAAILLRTLHPDLTFITANDRINVPYGVRSTYDIIRLTTEAIAPLLYDCDVIILACNTATAAAIEHLRRAYPSKKFIGYEPMLKPAAEATKSRHITVLATPSTLNSKRYQELKAIHTKDIIVDEPNIPNWAWAIDNDRLNEIDFSSVTNSVNSGSDTLVLACTHYVALTDELATRFPAATILEPTHAISRQLSRVINL